MVTIEYRRLRKGIYEVMIDGKKIAEGTLEEVSEAVREKLFGES